MFVKERGNGGLMVLKNPQGLYRVGFQVSSDE
jgi:hypothetical protein